VENSKALDEYSKPVFTKQIEASKSKNSLNNTNREIQQEIIRRTALLKNIESFGLNLNKQKQELIARYYENFNTGTDPARSKQIFMNSYNPKNWTTTGLMTKKQLAAKTLSYNYVPLKKLAEYGNNKARAEIRKRGKLNSTLVVNQDTLSMLLKNIQNNPMKGNVNRIREIVKKGNPKMTVQQLKSIGSLGDIVKMVRNGTLNNKNVNNLVNTNFKDPNKKLVRNYKAAVLLSKKGGQFTPSVTNARLLRPDVKPIFNSLLTKGVVPKKIAEILKQGGAPQSIINAVQGRKSSSEVSEVPTEGTPPPRQINRRENLSTTRKKEKQDFLVVPNSGPPVLINPATGLRRRLRPA
jgi:hypothetical protein